jgi:hypothetical protein
MLGISCLVLPMMGLQAGWGTTIYVSAFVAVMCYYTARLIVVHLGQGKNIKACILNHFNGEHYYMSGYSFIIWLSILPFLFTFFRVTCLQIEGLMGFSSPWVGPLVSLMLLVLVVVVRITQFMEETMAFGVLSIVLFVAFMIWAFATAPAGPKSVPVFGPPFVLAATLVNAYEIHDFFVQNVIKNPRRHEYHSIVKWTFGLGALVYTLSCMGSFAIVNRHSYVKYGEVVSDFFQHGQWQTVVLQLVYFIAAVTSFPNFLIISMYSPNHSGCVSSRCSAQTCAPR